MQHRTMLAALALLAFAATPALAIDYVSAADGNWGSTSTWSPAGVPGQGRQCQHRSPRGARSALRGQQPDHRVGRQVRHQRRLLGAGLRQLVEQRHRLAGQRLRVLQGAGRGHHRRHQPDQLLAALRQQVGHAVVGDPEPERHRPAIPARTRSASTPATS